jgi:small subunit ribosomal protein S20
MRLGFSPRCSHRTGTPPRPHKHNVHQERLVHLEEGTHVANIKSQIKRIKTNLKAQERNKAIKSELKTAIRRTNEAVASGDKATAEAALKNATKKLDKAVSKGVIHENQAANRKSSIAKKVAAL